MAELRVIVVDDDEWKRSAMAERLDATTEVDVVDAVDQDAAANWTSDGWKDIDAVLVDVLDDRAPGEVGTDLYSGITVLERVARLPIRSIAVTPSCAHPLVQLRLHQAHPDFVYHRWQVATLESLAEALRYPEREHRLPEPDKGQIKRLGGRKLLANDAVRTYASSPLHGKLKANIGLKELDRLGVSRRKVDRFKLRVAGHGFVYADTLSDEDRAREVNEVPRWPIIRDLMLTLLGRLDAPPTEFDKPWWREQI